MVMKAKITNLNSLQIPESHFDFQEKDKDLVVLGESTRVQDNGEWPFDHVFDGEAIDHIAESFVLLLIKLKQK
jgi:hypothetical protein